MRIRLLIVGILFLAACQQKKASSDKVAAAGRLIKIDSISSNIYLWHVKVNGKLQTYQSPMTLSKFEIDLLSDADTNIFFTQYEFLNPRTQKIELRMNSVSMRY